MDSFDFMSTEIMDTDTTDAIQPPKIYHKDALIGFMIIITFCGFFLMATALIIANYYLYRHQHEDKDNLSRHTTMRLSNHLEGSCNNNYQQANDYYDGEDGEGVEETTTIRIDQLSKEILLKF